MTLQQLGEKHRTDKATHGYLPTYEEMLGGMKNEPITLLELGIRGGQSLRMWREYFSNATIVGVDIASECKRHEAPGIRVEIGDQRDREFLEGLNIRPDVIIDDASHIHLWTLQSFKILWPLLQPGGVYIVEDMHCVSRPRDRVTRASQEEFYIADDERQNTPETKADLIAAIKEYDPRALITAKLAIMRKRQ